MKDHTTYGVDPERLARLLAIGIESADGQNNLGDGRFPAELLQAMLASKLSLDPAVLDSLPAVLNRSCDELHPLPDRTIGDLVLDAKTDLAVIKALKEYGKELVGFQRLEAKQAAATVIYYAAIANAMVFHGQKITEHSYPKLQQAYAKLEQTVWIPSELKKLFRKAHAVCGQQIEKPE